MVTLVSFDIDGTLEVGDPPGIVPITLVQTAKRLGYLIGSCSDRPVSHQESLWERLRIAVDFTVLKHELASVRARFAAAAYYHIGDTDVDDYYATGAGFVLAGALCLALMRAGAGSARAWIVLGALSIALSAAIWTVFGSPAGAPAGAER